MIFLELRKNHSSAMITQPGMYLITLKKSRYSIRFLIYNLLVFCPCWKTLQRSYKPALSISATANALYENFSWQNVLMYIFSCFIVK